MSETIYTIDIKKEKTIKDECRYLQNWKNKIEHYYTDDSENQIKIRPSENTNFQELKDYFNKENLILQKNDNKLFPFYIDCKKEVSDDELNIFLILQDAFDSNRILNWVYYRNHLEVEIHKDGNDEVLKEIREELKPFTKDLKSEIRWTCINKELVYAYNEGWDFLSKNSNPLQSYAVRQVYKAIQKKKCYDKMQKCLDRI